MHTVRLMHCQLPYKLSASFPVAGLLYISSLDGRSGIHNQIIKMFLNTRSLFVWCLAALLEAEAASVSSKPKPIILSESAPSNAGIPLDSFVSYSFELSSWPDFAGKINLSMRTVQNSH